MIDLKKLLEGVPSEEVTDAGIYRFAYAPFRKGNSAMQTHSERSYDYAILERVYLSTISTLLSNRKFTYVISEEEARIIADSARTMAKAAVRMRPSINEERP